MSKKIKGAGWRAKQGEEANGECLRLVGLVVHPAGESEAGHVGFA